LEFVALKYLAHDNTSKSSGVITGWAGGEGLERRVIEGGLFNGGASQGFRVTCKTVKSSSLCVVLLLS
jgi:hypothetical protein